MGDIKGFFKEAGEKTASFAKTAATKTGDAAKAAAEKTGDAIEISRVNGKIKDEQNNIYRQFGKLGEHFYKKAEEGMEMDAVAREIIENVKESEKKIAELQEQIELIKKY